MKKITTILYLLLIFIIVLISAWPMINGTIDFHTDIARDFLLLEDVYYNKNITLIGPRSGGIPGVFHGPLWLYINLPAYIIGGGNPVVVGWFWILLFIVSIAIVYYVSSKMFDRITAIFGSLLFASSTGSSVYAFFNPAGAVLLSPLFMYLLWVYINKPQIKILTLCMFVLGCLIQFQMAFGFPILAISLPIVFYIILKKVNLKIEKIKHLLAICIILIPLSSYLIFDLRHDFLQTKSAINFLTGVENTGKVEMSLNDFVMKRVNILISDTPGMIGGNVYLITLLVVFAFISIFVYGIKKFDLKNPYVLLALIYFGYWIVTIPYKGAFWGYYYWPFVSILSIYVASSHKIIGKKIFFIIISIVIANNINLLYQKHIKEKNLATGGWNFFHSVAQTVFKDAPSKFGYYIFTTDLFGYSSQYAMHYEDRKNTQKTSFPYEKKMTTYLLVDDPGNNSVVNSIDWKLYDVKIDKDPDKVHQKAPTFFIQKYQLSPEEINIPSNPNMLNSLIFR